jgi:hypothetical protein
VGTFICVHENIVDTANELVSVRIAGAKKRPRSVEERRKNLSLRSGQDLQTNRGAAFTLPSPTTVSVAKQFLRSVHYCGTRSVYK